MAKTIFQYHSNIYILEDPVAYRKEVVRYLDLIKTTYTGQTLLKYIYARGRRLLIVPYIPANEKKFGPVNAYATPDATLDAYKKDFPVNGTMNVPGIGEVIVPAAFKGTGAGSPVTLKYHPAIYRQLMANRGGQVFPGDGPGEVLFHEMVHAFRMMSGRMIDAVVTEDAAMDNFEEFCAIVAGNMYRSERGFKLMRANHKGSTPLSTDMSNSARYAAHFEDEITKWFGQQRAFVLELAKSNAAFNPLRSAAIEMGLMTTPMAL